MVTQDSHMGYLRHLVGSSGHLVGPIGYLDCQIGCFLLWELGSLDGVMECLDFLMGHLESGSSTQASRRSLGASRLSLEETG